MFGPTKSNNVEYFHCFICSCRSETPTIRTDSRARNLAGMRSELLDKLHPNGHFLPELDDAID